MFVDGPVNTERNTSEPPECSEYEEGYCSKDDPLRLLRQPTRREDEVIKDVRGCEHSEVQRRQLFRA